MSKVVHLSDEAHNRAKAFCKDKGLRMSDWVAALIADAIVKGSQPAVRAPAPPVHTVVAEPAAPAANVPKEVVPKKKPLHRVVESKPVTPVAEEGVPAYAAPPFWARKR